MSTDGEARGATADGESGSDLATPRAPKDLPGATGHPQIPDAILAAARAVGQVESRMGAVAWGLRPTLRFPSPLIKPSAPISGTRLSDWLHHKAHDVWPLYAGVQRDDTLGT